MRCGAMRCDVMQCEESQMVIRARICLELGVTGMACRVLSYSTGIYIFIYYDYSEVSEWVCRRVSADWMLSWCRVNKLYTLYHIICWRIASSHSIPLRRSRMYRCLYYSTLSFRIHHTSTTKRKKGKKKQSTAKTQNSKLTSKDHLL